MQHTACTVGIEVLSFIMLVTKWSHAHIYQYCLTEQHGKTKMRITFLVQGVVLLTAPGEYSTILGWVPLQRLP